MRTDPFRLTGKTVVITGASSGIGQECAIQCSQSGARVIALGRDETRLKSTMDLMDKALKHTSVSVDLTDFDRTEELLKQSLLKDEKVHGLVHCAGISTTQAFRLSKPEQMDHFFHTNVHGAINLSRIVLKQPNLVEQGTSIIFIASVMGIVGESGKTMYSMTKGAILAGVRSLAIEMAPKNIRVNAISPGVVETPMSRSAVYNRNEEAFEKVRQLHPLGIGNTADIAYASIFLLSDASRWITGENLVVDGGYSAR